MIQRTTIVTPTPRLDRSLDFYRRLGFTQFVEENLVGDGQVVIEIESKRHARAGIRLEVDDVAAVVAELETIGRVYRLGDTPIAIAPTGTWVYLSPVAEHPAGGELPRSTLGRCVGLSLESPDMDTSDAFWRLLGWHVSDGSIDDGYVSYKHATGLDVTIMLPLACPHLFFNPSLTYFNGAENVEVIRRIRAADVPITQEITWFNKTETVDNVILRDPGGYGFFVFND